MIQQDQFIERLSKKGYTKHDAAIIAEDFIKTLEEALAGGESVMFRGFGTFEVKERAARSCISVHGEEITIPPYRAPVFSAGKRLKREVKEGLIRE